MNLKTVKTTINKAILMGDAKLLIEGLYYLKTSLSGTDIFVEYFDFISGLIFGSKNLNYSLVRLT